MRITKLFKEFFESEKSDSFTMSIFITILAFEQRDIENNSKLMILIASAIAGTIGYFLLKKTLSRSSNKDIFNYQQKID